MNLSEARTKARALSDAGKLREAAALCQEILKESPQDAPASYLLGCVAYKSGDAESALKYMGQAVENDPRNGGYKRELCSMLLETRRPEAAEKLLTPVLEVEPSNQTALLLLGYAQAMQGRQDAAIDGWQRLLSLRLRPWLDRAGEALNHPFNTADYDQPDYDGERLIYIICSTPRSGSTLLGDLLVQSGKIGVPHEYMNFAHMAAVLANRFGVNPADPYCFRAYCDALKRKRTTANGVFGIKMHFNMFHSLLEPPLLETAFPKPRFVQTMRHNRIAQAVSFAIAAQTGKWNSTNEARNEPQYNEAQIDQCLSQILNQESRWMKFFQIHAIRPHVVHYEDLVADSTAVCRNLAAYLGVETDFDFKLAGADFNKVGSGINAEWEDRFRSARRVLSV